MSVERELLLYRVVTMMRRALPSAASTWTGASTAPEYISALIWCEEEECFSEAVLWLAAFKLINDHIKDTPFPSIAEFLATAREVRAAIGERPPDRSFSW